MTAEFPPGEAVLEVLAHLEHLLCISYNYLSLYIYFPFLYYYLMLHPDLVVWEELTESDKDKDRQNIIEISRLVAMRGEKICTCGDSA